MEVIRISSGDLVKELAARIDELAYERVAVLAVVGAVDAFSLTNMKADDPKTDLTTEFDMPGEISGVGEVIKGWVNIHATLGVEGGTCYSGHLASAKIETHFVRVFVEPFAAPKKASTPPPQP